MDGLRQLGALIRGKTAVLAGILSLSIFSFFGCGQAGEGGSSSCTICGQKTDLAGSITSATSGSANLSGWVLVMAEKDTDVCRIATIDGTGNYTLQKVDTSQEQTLYLLSPNYIIRSVLTMPGSQATRIRQYFKPTDKTLPRLIADGPVIRFQTTSNIKINKKFEAADDNADSVPNGSQSLGVQPLELNLVGDSYFLDDYDVDLDGLNLIQSAAKDIDLDKLLNEEDGDLDGDGITNAFDPDDNGNAIYDIFDGDSNSDFKADDSTDGQNTAQYFPVGVEYVAVKFEMITNDSGTEETAITFETKVRRGEGRTPTGVVLLGATDLLRSGQVSQIDPETNEETLVDFAGELKDEGLPADGNKDDNIFGAKVILPNGTQPRAHEVMFVSVQYGKGTSAWSMEFPYTFMPVTVSPVDSLYEANSRTVQILGLPFGDCEAGCRDYVWKVQVYRDDIGTDESSPEAGLVWESQKIPGGEQNFQIPEETFVSGQTYSYVVIASVREKVPGNPAYSIHSARTPIE